mgnify:CR=1 FL=1
MKVIKCSQIKAAEENAVQNGIFSYTALMENAGKAAAKAIFEKYNVIVNNVMSAVITKYIGEKYVNTK